MAMVATGSTAEMSEPKAKLREGGGETERYLIGLKSQATVAKRKEEENTKLISGDGIMLLQQRRQNTGPQTQKLPYKSVRSKVKFA